MTRQEQDLFATRSQNKAEQAQKSNYFEKEIIPVNIQTRKETLTITKDEFPRHGTTYQALEKLRPAFVTVCMMFFTALSFTKMIEN